MLQRIKFIVKFTLILATKLVQSWSWWINNGRVIFRKNGKISKEKKEKEQKEIPKEREWWAKIKWKSNMLNWKWKVWPFFIWICIEIVRIQIICNYQKFNVNELLALKSTTVL